MVCALQLSMKKCVKLYVLKVWASLITLPFMKLAQHCVPRKLSDDRGSEADIEN